MRRISSAALVIHALASCLASPALAEPTPKLFVSCAQDCYEPYLHQELSYFDFVRDQHLADYTLVVVRQTAGNGGERFSVTLVRGNSSAGASLKPTQSFVAAPGSTVQANRRDLVQVILRIMHAVFSGTPREAEFELKLPARSGRMLSTLHDPWHYWVVAPELSGYGEGGSGYYSAILTSALTVRRVTEPSKIRLRGSYTRQLSSYKLEDGSRVSGDIYAWAARALYARSLGQRWALGGTSTGQGSEFENLEGHVHGGPLAEFNLFPYAQSESKQLRFAYQAGAWANWYFERNRDGLRRELRPYHAVSVIADINQTWGSLQLIGQYNSFLDAPKLYRVSSGVVVAIRLLEGLAVSVEGEAAFVRDLVNLRRRPITDLELLLRTAQQPTDFTVRAQFSVTYTFGSVYNTIVNPRFARVDLDEE